jgi:metal-responsive CopG/Arc/MetJ family transcriptional regulator
MATGAIKVTISVPHDLVAVADEVAHEKKVSRSKVISSCLQDLAAERLHKKMAEGYKALAKENLRFAEGAVDSANEALSRRE